MGGQSSQNTQQSQNQSSTTAPWQPTQGLLTNIIGGLNGQANNMAPTGAESGAINTIQQNAQNTPNYGAQATDLTNNLFNGGGANNQAPMVNDAYSQYQKALTPYAQGMNLDPTTAPGMAGVLSTIQNDVGNSVNGMFAGAGRDMSGMNQQALARGISQGEAAPLLSQYNQNVQNMLNSGANLYSAGNTTAGTLAGFNQTALGNQAQGFNTMQQIPGAANNSANATLQAGQVARGLPLSNMGQLLNLTLPIAGLGSQNTGQSTGTSNTTNQMSGMQQALMGTQMFSNVSGGLFGNGGAVGGIKGMLSDRRLKKDIEQVGELYDGTPVYRFRYINDPIMRVGLMADDVEKYAPESIEVISGYKAVDYAKATDRALEMGAR